MVQWKNGLKVLHKDFNMMRIFWLLRRRIKHFISQYTTIIESCQQCGIKQPIVWWSDNELWKFLTGKENSGIYYPSCFSKLAEDHGLILMWKPEIEISFHKKYKNDLSSRK